MIKAIGNKIILKKDEKESVSTGGIVIVASAQEKSTSGIVVSVGEGFYDDNDVLIPIQAEVGDRVIFSKNSGVLIEFEDEELLVIDAGDVFGRIK